MSIKDIFDSFFEAECSIERVRSAEETGLTLIPGFGL